MAQGLSLSAERDPSGFEDLELEAEPRLVQMELLPSVSGTQVIRARTERFLPRRCSEGLPQLALL